MERGKNCVPLLKQHTNINSGWAQMSKSNTLKLSKETIKNIFTTGKMRENMKKMRNLTTLKLRMP